MLIPLGDEPNAHLVRPWVNWLLIAANVVVFVVAKAKSGGEVGYTAWTVEWGYVPVAPRVETWFTSMFMHGDWMHLGGNMLFLWIFGDNVEGRLGHVGYLLAYVAAGIGAVLLFHVLSPGSSLPLVGASGAIFGVEGFYFLAFPRNRVRVLYWFMFAGVAMVSARMMIGMYFLLNLLYTFGTRPGTGGVAYAAHVGGFVVGFVVALLLRSKAPTPERDPELEDVRGRFRPWS